MTPRNLTQRRQDATSPVIFTVSAAVRKLHAGAPNHRTQIRRDSTLQIFGDLAGREFHALTPRNLTPRRQDAESSLIFQVSAAFREIHAATPGDRTHRRKVFRVVLI